MKMTTYIKIFETVVPHTQRNNCALVYTVKNYAMNP